MDSLEVDCNVEFDDDASPLSPMVANQLQSAFLGFLRSKQLGVGKQRAKFHN